MAPEFVLRTAAFHCVLINGWCTQVVVNMDALAAESAAAFASADVAFCTLGTKRRIAGSAEAYVKARIESACLQTFCRQRRRRLKRHACMQLQHHCLLCGT